MPGAPLASTYTPNRPHPGALDGLRPYAPRAGLGQPPSTATPQHRIVKRSFDPGPKYRPKTSDSKRHKLWKRFQLPLFILGSIVAGMMVQAIWFGVALVVLYGICSVVFRIKSSTTFTLAIISLLAVVAIMATQPASNLANNFANYAFLLLTIGVITLTIEAKPQRRKKKRRGGR